MFRGDANPVIPDKEDRSSVLLAALTDLHTRLGLAAHEFGGIIDQVLHHLDQALAISVYGRQVGLHLHADSAGLQASADQLQGFMRHTFK
jgi:hypothetical protein